MTGFMDISIVGNERGVQRMLSRLDSAFSPVGLTLFMHGSVEPWLERRARDRFATEGDDVTGKWKPLAQTTQEFREHAGHGASHPINRRTGELEAYITGTKALVSYPGPAITTLTYPGNPPSGPMLKRKVTTAQKGHVGPKTPPRPVLGVNERDLAYVMTQLAFFIQKGVFR